MGQGEGDRLWMGSGGEVGERNTKSQTPSSGEIPEPKHQRNPKFQAPNRGPRFELGASLVFGSWEMELLWSLEFGVWSFNWDSSVSRGGIKKARSAGPLRWEPRFAGHQVPVPTESRNMMLLWVFFS